MERFAIYSRVARHFFVEPSSHTAILKHLRWKEAMDIEYNALMNNETWKLVPPRKDPNIIGCKWVFKLKQKLDGSIDRYKARLVAKGFAQSYGINHL